MQRPSERSFPISMDAQREADAAHTHCFLDSGPPVIPQRQLQPRGGRAGCRRRDRRQPCPQTPNPAVTDAQPCPAPQAGLAAAVDGAFRPLRFPFFALVLTWARSVGCACADVGMGQDKVAKEGQSGKTAFSQGGVNGPNKLEGLVAFGSLKPGEAPRSRSSARRHAPHPPAALGCLDAAKSSLGGLWLSACGVDSRLAETPLRQRSLGAAGGDSAAPKSSPSVGRVRQLVTGAHSVLTNVLTCSPPVCPLCAGRGLTPTPRRRQGLGTASVLPGLMRRTVGGVGGICPYLFMVLPGLMRGRIESARGRGDVGASTPLSRDCSGE